MGGSEENQADLKDAQQKLADDVQDEIDRLEIEGREDGWRPKTFLYCMETRCPESGWRVPMLRSLIVSKDCGAIAELAPDPKHKRYDIKIHNGVDEEALRHAERAGTVRKEPGHTGPALVHTVDGKQYKSRVSTLRGDVRREDGTTQNDIRRWGKTDIAPRAHDVLAERLYCILWTRRKENAPRDEYDFRKVSEADIRREARVHEHVERHLKEWQQKGWVPDLRIEAGGAPKHSGRDLIQNRGWTHWHHVFNPRQLLLGALINARSDAKLKFGLTRALDRNAKLSGWSNKIKGGGGNVENVFADQNLALLDNYGCRSAEHALRLVRDEFKQVPIPEDVETSVTCRPANKFEGDADLFITDPPYGDAVDYSTILDFFIAWLRKKPPAEFADWTWDGRRALAIRGEHQGFRRNMVAAYKRMTERMAPNGLQIIMFTHQGGKIWGEMTNILWAAGLQVTAAWYVRTERDSTRKHGTFVKGTVLLVCRKRSGDLKTTRGDLAWEIKDEVKEQVRTLTGLNQSAKGRNRDENLFEDADLQMAGYAAAIRTLTRYRRIDGKDMQEEAIRPRKKDEKTAVDELIEFAAEAANRCLVPRDIGKRVWDKLTRAERFYLKMLELEARGASKLDDYQNFQKAFRVSDHSRMMGDNRANRARLKGAIEFGNREMSENSQLHGSVLRAVLYAIMEIAKDIEVLNVLKHMSEHITDYYADKDKRQRAIAISDYLAKHLGAITRLHPEREAAREEAQGARVLAEAMRNQRLG